MTTLYCDLDNTLIYSHRKTLNVNKRVVERLNGREQSYMTERTYSFLKSLSNTRIIPVTTRTMEQFLRLKETLAALNCCHAVIYNGAVLLRNWEIDTSWLMESRELAEESTDDMQIAKSFLYQDCNAYKKCYFERLFCYASVEDPPKVAQSLRERVNESLVDVFYDRRKVYCAPKAINKGAAVNRLSKLIESELTIGIGDSDNDLPMLSQVDMPIAPETLKHGLNNPKLLSVPCNSILSDAGCDRIKSVLDRYCWSKSFSSATREP